MGNVQRVSKLSKVIQIVPGILKLKLKWAKKRMVSSPWTFSSLRHSRCAAGKKVLQIQLLKNDKVICFLRKIDQLSCKPCSHIEIIENELLGLGSTINEGYDFHQDFKGNG